MSNVLSIHRTLTIRIELIGTDPKIWRSLDIDGGLDLAEAGQALQIAMGWEHAHLYAFHSAHPYQAEVPEQLTSWYNKYSLDEMGIGEPQELTTLAQALKAANGELYFEYDFGDCWMHRITIESQRTRTAEETKYRVLDGELRAPLEDSGGVSGWYEALEVFRRGASNEDEEDLLDEMRWAGGPWNPFDPEVFDLQVANRRLAMLAEDFSGTNAVGRWVGALPDGLRQYLSMILAQADLSMEPTGQPIPGWFVDLVSPFAVLAELCLPGLRLTKAGWMPPAVLAELVRRSGWERIDYSTGTNLRENNMPTVAFFREMAIAIGLVRKSKDVLTTTQRGRKLMHDPEALAGYVADKLRSAKPLTAEGDGAYAEWIIWASGMTMNFRQPREGDVSRYADRSTILRHFGYRDPETNGPIGRRTFFPTLQLWHLVSMLIRFHYVPTADRDENQSKYAELSRFLLEA